jgi:predicted oxidoreductase
MSSPSRYRSNEPISRLRSQVVDVDGNPIVDLYAAGNCSSGVAAYWAGGTTLGQGSVMGFAAAKHICGK